MRTFGNIQVFLLLYNLLKITHDHCQYHRFFRVVKFFLMHLHSSYDEAAILLPPFSIYCEQTFVYFN